MGTDGGAHSQRLVASVVADGFDASTVETSEAPGPLDLRTLRAAARDAYPGTGVRTALLDASGVAYGTRVDRDLADLARARGWLQSPPAATDLLAAANVALFDGMLALAEDAPQLRQTSDGALELRFVRVAFPSGAREPMEVRIGTMGRAEVRKLPAEGPGEPTPIDATTGLMRALDGGQAAEIARALGSVPRPFGARELAAFARAAVLPNEDIATTALVTMGGSPEAISALREALDSAPERRGEVSGWVAELYGDAVAAALRG